MALLLLEPMNMLWVRVAKTWHGFKTPTTMWLYSHAAALLVSSYTNAIPVTLKRKHLHLKLAASSQTPFGSAVGAWTNTNNSNGQDCRWLFTIMISWLWRQTIAGAFTAGTATLGPASCTGHFWEATTSIQIPWQPGTQKGSHADRNSMQ